MINHPELSVVILCYRSEEQIIGFSQEVKELAEKLTDSYEIILVGNYIEGSVDRTKEIVEQIAREDSVFKTITKPKRGMMGWDMKEGLSCTKGDFICVIDGDGQFPIESITNCFEKIKTGEFGLVKTYRQRRNDGAYRKLVSVVYNMVFSILFPKVRSNDVNSKPKMFTRDLLDRLALTSDDWFIDAEIVIETNRLGINFYEFPIEFYELHGRVSFVRFSAIFEFIRNLFYYRFKGK